jgi:glycosyltransferase involved in cell wall biosynthesis
MPISVVIPAYNSAAFIRETLNSVFAQTRLPAEIIVVDDASADETPSIVETMAADSPMPLRLIRLPNNTGGPAIPLNVGIEAAAGDAIALLDHDDLMLPHKIAAQNAVLEEQPDIDLVMGDYESFSAQGDLPGTDARSIGKEWHARLTPGPGPIHRVPARDCLSAFVLFPGLARGCGNFFFRKSFWERAGRFDAASGASSDYDFILRAIDRPIAWIDRKLFRRREHDSNLWNATVRNRLQTLRSQRQCLARCSLPPEVRDAVVDSARYIACNMRLTRHYFGAMQVGFQLACLGERRLAMRECWATSLYPFRAIMRKAENLIKARPKA